MADNQEFEKAKRFLQHHLNRDIADDEVYGWLTCLECPTDITLEQLNNQMGKCDICFNVWLAKMV